MADDQHHHNLDRLLRDLSASELPEEGDLVSYYQDMLALVAYDAIRGIDIPSSYPTFYKHLLSNYALQAAFEDAVDLLRAARPRVRPPQVDLSFLPKNGPRIMEQINGRWQAAWVFTQQYLLEQFNAPSTPSPEVAFREAPQVMDDDVTTIFRESHMIGGQTFHIWLKFLLSPTADQFAFEPQVTVRTAAGDSLPENMEVWLQWAEYEEHAPLPKSGVATLPTIAGDMMFDENNRITAELKFELRHT